MILRAKLNHLDELWLRAKGQTLLVVRKENVVHLSKAGMSLPYNILSNHTTSSVCVQIDLQLSGPTASCDGQQKLLYYEDLSSAAKGEKVWRTFGSEDREDFTHAGRGRSSAGSQIHMQEKSLSDKKQPHTNYTPNEAGTVNSATFLLNILLPRLLIQE